MSTDYYETIDRMQKKGVDPDYINGWASGYLHNPRREEQRINGAYEAGYEHGHEINIGDFEAWIRKQVANCRTPSQPARAILRPRRRRARRPRPSRTSSRASTAIRPGPDRRPA